MLGDGRTRYDLGNDGEVNSIASCSVSCSPFLFSSTLTFDDLQANFRQTNVPTKFRLTYVKDGYLDVSWCHHLS